MRGWMHHMINLALFKHHVYAFPARAFTHTFARMRRTGAPAGALLLLLLLPLLVVVLLLVVRHLSTNRRSVG